MPDRRPTLGAFGFRNLNGKLRRTNFSDLTGQTINGCTVLREAPTVDGNSRWLVRADCGHDVILTAMLLRARQQRGAKAYRCAGCRGMRNG